MVPYKNVFKIYQGYIFYTLSHGKWNVFFLHFSMFCVIKKGPSYVVSCRFLSILI